MHMVVSGNLMSNKADMKRFTDQLKQLCRPGFLAVLDVGKWCIDLRLFSSGCRVVVHLSIL